MNDKIVIKVLDRENMDELSKHLCEKFTNEDCSLVELNIKDFLGENYKGGKKLFMLEYKDLPKVTLVLDEKNQLKFSFDRYTKFYDTDYFIKFTDLFELLLDVEKEILEFEYKEQEDLKDVTVENVFKAFLDILKEAKNNE